MQTCPPSFCVVIFVLVKPLDAETVDAAYHLSCLMSTKVDGLPTSFSHFPLFFVPSALFVPRINLSYSYIQNARVLTLQTKRYWVRILTPKGCHLWPDYVLPFGVEVGGEHAVNVATFPTRTSVLNRDRYTARDSCACRRFIMSAAVGLRRGKGYTSAAGEGGARCEACLLWVFGG